MIKKFKFLVAISIIAVITITSTVIPSNASTYYKAIDGGQRIVSNNDDLRVVVSVYPTYAQVMAIGKDGDAFRRLYGSLEIQSQDGTFKKSLFMQSNKNKMYWNIFFGEKIETMTAGKVYLTGYNSKGERIKISVNLVYVDRITIGNQLIAH